MNMLIAIMSNTFAEVLEDAESNTLAEQLSLIFDNMFIINFNRMFKNHKYILRISVTDEAIDEEDPIETAIQNSTHYIVEKVLDQGNRIQK